MGFIKCNMIDWKLPKEIASFMGVDKKYNTYNRLI